MVRQLGVAYIGPVSPLPVLHVHGPLESVQIHVHVILCRLFREAVLRIATRDRGEGSMLHESLADAPVVPLWCFLHFLPAPGSLRANGGWTAASAVGPAPCWAQEFLLQCHSHILLQCKILKLWYTEEQHRDGSCEQQNSQTWIYSYSFLFKKWAYGFEAVQPAADDFPINVARAQQRPDHPYSWGI